MGDEKLFSAEVDLVLLFQSFLRMATAADIAKLETKAVAAEKLIELLRQQISQVLLFDFYVVINYLFIIDQSCSICGKCIWIRT